MLFNFMMTVKDVISEQVPAVVSNVVWETKIFCHRFLKIGNSAVRQYFQMNFCEFSQYTSKSKAQKI